MVSFGNTLWLIFANGLDQTDVGMRACRECLGQGWAKNRPPREPSTESEPDRAGAVACLVPSVSCESKFLFSLGIAKKGSPTARPSLLWVELAAPQQLTLWAQMGG